MWLISFAVSVAGYILYGYGPSGGICYYMNDAGLFAELIQFLPRAIVFLVIAILYGKLYVFLRRPDKIRTGYTDTPVGSSSYSKLKSSWFGSSRRSRRRAEGGGGLFGHGGHNTVIIDKNGHRIGKDSALMSSGGNSSSEEEAPEVPQTRVIEVPTPRRPAATHQKSHRTVKRHIPSDAPPWEHVELPVFQVDGQRYGGQEADPIHQRDSMWRDWSGFGRQHKHASTTSMHSSQATRVPGTDTSPFASPVKASFDKGLTSPTATLFEDKVSPTRSTFDHQSLSPTTTYFPSPSNSPPRAMKNHSEVPGTHGPKSSPNEDGSSFSSDDVAEVTKPPPAVTRNPVPVIGLYEDFNMEQRRGSIPDGTIPFRRASKIAMPSNMVLPTTTTGTASFLSNPGGSIAGNIAELPRVETPAMYLARDVEKGLDGDDDDDDEDTWDLARMLKEEPPSTANDPFQVQQTQASEGDEYVAESMASYLNRKASLLMLWFPLGYVLLFSVSTIRIIYDFVGSPPPELRAISRWTMFGQGILDGVIYGVIEYHTKRVVRRRVRKGTFSPRTSRGSQGATGGGSALGNAVRGGISGLSGRSRPTSPMSANKQTASRREGASPTVSFADPETSIMQRLDTKQMEAALRLRGSDSGSSDSAETKELKDAV